MLAGICFDIDSFSYQGTTNGGEARLCRAVRAVSEN
jgi:hypothetical protein